jgi:hypothetical protein
MSSADLSQSGCDLRVPTTWRRQSTCAYSIKGKRPMATAQVRSETAPSTGKKMSDNQNERTAAPPGYIRLSEPPEVRYWMREFGCTETELVGAVVAVGNSTRAVCHYFARPNRWRT